MLERRQFLQASALAGAGLLWPQQQTDAQDDPPTEEPLNVALIGIGLQGRTLMNSLVQIPGIRIVAVCDMWEYARRYGKIYLRQYYREIAAYATHQELLSAETALDADGIDLLSS